MNLISEASRRWRRFIRLTVVGWIWRRIHWRWICRGRAIWLIVYYWRTVLSFVRYTLPTWVIRRKCVDSVLRNISGRMRPVILKLYWLGRLVSLHHGLSRRTISLVWVGCDRVRSWVLACCRKFGLMASMLLNLMDMTLRSCAAKWLRWRILSRGPKWWQNRPL